MEIKQFSDEAIMLMTDNYTQVSRDVYGVYPNGMVERIYFTPSQNSFVIALSHSSVVDLKSFVGYLTLEDVMELVQPVMKLEK